MRNKYPYSDFHELNSDFLLREYYRMKTGLEKMQKKIDTLSLQKIINSVLSEINATEVRY